MDVPFPPRDSLPTFIVPPVAQDPLNAPALYFKALDVELYQTCPVNGAGGSEDRDCTF